MTAIQMATLNTAQHFGLEREIGSIAPGRRADLLVTSDLATAADRDRRSRAARCWRGMASSRPTSAPAVYPASAQQHGAYGARVDAPADFDIAAPPGAAKVRARVIGVIENQAPTRALDRMSSPSATASSLMDRPADVCQIAARRAPSRHGRRRQRLRLGLRLQRRLRRRLHRRPRQPPHDRRRHLQEPTWRWRPTGCARSAAASW